MEKYFPQRARDIGIYASAKTPDEQNFAAAFTNLENARLAAACGKPGRAATWTR